MGISSRDYMREWPTRRLGQISAITVIIGINILIFLLWRFRDHTFLQENFMVNLGRLKDGRLWTPLTSVFSHYHMMHLFINMFVLWSFGTVLERQWGTRRFVIFYLSAGVVASLAHCFLSLLGMRDGSALGASGAVSGLVLAFCILHPRHTVLLFGLIPMPAFVMALLFIGIDVFGLMGQLGQRGTVGGTQIGHGAHLGGAAFAALYMLLGRSRALQFRRSRRSSRPSPATFSTLNRTP
ncbi:MAG: rhomboid family intramembrane serine protease, partial [Planctomycetota bacterium]